MNLDTKRLRLRLFSASDVDSLVELDSDPEVMRYISGGANTPKEVYADMILPRMLAYPLNHPGMGFFAIECKARGGFLGWAHLRPDRFEQSWAEVGYRLRRVLWNQGIATEVTKSLIAHAFDKLEVATVSARTHRDNGASRRVMEKCGLSFAGTFEHPASTIGTLQLPAAPCVLYLRQRTIDPQEPA